ncbi:perforin-like protein 2 [Plasmodium gonderi]|uniref:Perforin-like protein 2 n=1 Tax=Plasmodium gonderi TaxID=77519 RepID=A0A1Y1JM64_PLAGO|nr:perforin-like protein 2 [Plasmodium gonderi]GAW83549.1 perforin-like protein 2 [Plasmodium gonderi]
MRTTVESIFVHLLVVYFSIYCMKCEANGNLHFYENGNEYNLENFNFSNLLNEEKSYIIDINSIRKNKRLKNNNGMLLSSPLYGCFNKYARRQYRQNDEYEDMGVKSNEKSESIKCSGHACSSFMLIKEHKETGRFKEKDGNKTNRESCNLQKEKETSKKLHDWKEKVDQAIPINKHNYNSIMLDLMGKHNKNQLSNNLYINNLKEKKKYINTESIDVNTFSHFMTNTVTPSKHQQNIKEEKNKIRIQKGNKKFIQNENERFKNGGENIEPFLSYSDSMGYSGENFFEKEKFIEVKFPININTNETEKDDNVDYEKDIIKGLTDQESLQNSSDMNYSKYMNITENNNSLQENQDIANSKFGEDDIIGILKNPNNIGIDDVFINNTKNKILKTLNTERKGEYSKEFDLKDALISDIVSLHNTKQSVDEKEFKEIDDNMLKNGINNEKPITDDKAQNTDIDLSLKYLGLGYDIIMGNPEGDPTINVDPGFRGPVLQINIEEPNVYNNSNIRTNSTNGIGVPHSSSSLGKRNLHKDEISTEDFQPKLTPWVIPEHSCSQSKNVEEIRNLEQYKLELLTDVKVSTPFIFPYSFSASAEYKNALKKLKVQNNVIFMMKIYCLRYYTGIPTTTTWRFTENFKNALKKLPPSFDGLKDDSECSYEYYVNKLNTPKCEETVNKWMLFFKLHGTHVAHEIYLGGKIVIKMNMDKEEYNKLKDNNISIKTFFNLYFHKMGLSAAYNKQAQKILSKFRTSKDVSILGGNPGLNIENTTFFEKWVQSINKNSMPIRTKLLPFSYFMDDPNMILAYKDALTFYGLTYGVQIFGHEKYSHVVLSIGEYLEKCTQELYAGPPPGLLTCPLGTTLLMGFSINLDFYKSKDLSNINGMSSCEQMKESCSGNGFGKKYSDIRIWGLCSQKQLDFITQVVQQGNSAKITATCPGDLVILFGFALMKGNGSSSANKVDIYPCRTGQTSCSAVLQNSKMKQSMIYIACVDKSTNGLENIQTYSKVKNMGSVNSGKDKDDEYLNFTCPKNSSLVFGFSLEFHTNFAKTRNNFTDCSKHSNSCQIKGTRINTNLSFFRPDKYSLAIIAVCRAHTDVHRGTTNMS